MLRLVLSVSLAALASAQPVKPTLADVPYGPHPRQVIDFYKAESDKPTPLVLFIHGGGWGALDKQNATKLLDLPALLKVGISVAAVNYRFYHQAQKAGVHPPVKWPLEDAARALQFVRSKAREWNIDKVRIGASGGSAGACSSLWLALHSDMAQPDSTDPVARESTRLFTAAVVGAQTSLDPHQMREWMPNITYGGHAFGFRTDGKDKQAEFQRFSDAREKVLPFIREYSPIEHVSPDDPPLWLSYAQKEVGVKGEPQQDPTHSVLFGMLLAEKTGQAGVETTVTYPARPSGRYRNPTEYLIEKLRPAEKN